MNRHDLKNPLVQSGALLLVAFLLISIVAGSDSGGIWGSISALISGLFSAVIFIIALSVAITLSIAVIVGIYIAAVSMYSVDKGRDLIDQIKGSLSSVSSKLGEFKNTRKNVPEAVSTKPAGDSLSSAAAPTEVTSTASARHVAPNHQTDSGTVEEKINAFDTQLHQVAQATMAGGAQLETLQRRVDALSESAATEARLVAAVEETQQAVRERLDELSAGLETNKTALENLAQQFGEKLEALQQDVISLHEKTSVPELISGILSYIDTQEDRDLVTEKAEEAISRNMTYSQIDDFFKDSLPPAVYEELAAHPRLTKDFLRSIKKKF